MPTIRLRNVAVNMLQRTIITLLLYLTLSLPLSLVPVVVAAAATHNHATPTIAAAAAEKARQVMVQGDGGGEVIGATSLAASAAAIYAATAPMLQQRAAASHSTNIHSNNNNNNEHFDVVEENFYDDHKSGDGNNDDLMLTKSANLLLEDLQQQNKQLINLTRQHDGDIFRTNGVSSCNADTCVGLSSGTAGLLHMGNERNGASGLASAVGSLAGGSNSQLELLTRRLKLQQKQNIANGNIGGNTETCDCRCLTYLPTYREDLGICVDDIHECTLSPFVSGSSSEKIPLVILPLRGQIIHPSREISFPDINTPVCAVTGAQFLTSNGWSDLRNPIDSDYPFRMFRDEGRTFLQWLGESDLRQRMQGRLIVVHLVCRDMTITLNATAQEHLMTPKNVFSPCVAFRVNGSPVKNRPNVPYTTFQSETTTPLASISDGMTTKEYVVIGVCSLLLGLIYVSSVFLYLHMKKRKSREQSHLRNSLDDLANEINYPKNDQVTFGAPFNRAGSIYSATSMGTSNEPRSRTSIGSLKEEMGIVKNNPLLQHFPQLGEHNSGFASDISNSNSECEMDSGSGFHDKLKQMQTSALVHPQLGMNSMNMMSMSVNANGNGNGSPKGISQSNNGACGGHGGNEQESLKQEELSSQENECLPVENVAIIEDMMSEEKLENLRAMVNGNIRKKLYFNPAYFEPHLLAEPPQAALEFLQKIREVIAIAKYKMATKRYQPSLIVIPEEHPLGSMPPPSQYPHSPQNTMPSQAECNGCANNRCSGHVKNCGDKRNSIEKWLQTVPSTETQQEKSPNGTSNARNSSHEDSKLDITNSLEEQREQSPSKSTSSGSTSTTTRSISSKRTSPDSSNKSLPRKDISAPKERPPPPPANGKPNKSPTHRNNSMVQTTLTSQNPRKSKENDSSVSTTDYQHYCTKISTGSIVNIPVKRNYDSFSALSAAANIYGFAETGGEIYNNPKFMLHDSPAASQHSHDSSHRSKSPRKRLDVLDHFAAATTPTSLNSADRQHYNMLRNMKQTSGIYDSLSREYNSRTLSNGSFHLDIPTPDYDSTMEKKIKDIYSGGTQSSIPSVPTPDYSSLSRKSLKQFQPDSPIYRRKSPQYLIVDYETDSLERLEAVTKRKSSHSSSSPSSDVSSQLSPSLSTALPLEEEMEISHTVYDRIDGFRKDGNVKKKVVNKPTDTVEKHKEIAARIKYDTPFRGSMTIEVEHEPPSDMERTDSDQFEPDTLDRKPKKQSFCDVNAWKQQKNRPMVNGNYDDTEFGQINSLPDLSRSQVTPSPIYGGTSCNDSFVLRPSNSFRSQSGKSSSNYESQVELLRTRKPLEGEDAMRANFSHLREIYQQIPLSRENSRSSNCKCSVQSKDSSQEQRTTDNGRLLTLEAKHSRRQRVLENTDHPQAKIEITKISSNKTTIKITTPKASRAAAPIKQIVESAIVEPRVHSSGRYSPSNLSTTSSSNSRSVMATLYSERPPTNVAVWCSKSGSNSSNYDTTKQIEQRKRTPPPPPPPQATMKGGKAPSPSPTSPTQQSSCSDQESNPHCGLHYQNQRNLLHRESNILNGQDDETMSTVSESTEITRVSDTVQNSEFENSCNNTLSSVANDGTKTLNTNTYNKLQSSTKQSSKKPKDENDYDAMFNTKIKGLRNDYSLTKYLNRRKSHDQDEEPPNNECNESDPQFEANNNTKNLEVDPNKLDVLSISSRSNRSSSRLSDRTKEMYRNAGVPVGIAYPQRSSTNSVTTTNGSTTVTNNVQTVYRCEIEPVQLTSGMQIAMGLKDRAKKAKDLKNAWRKFVSMAASKFSPSQSPAPPYENKKTPSFLEILDRDEGISSLIDDQPHVSTPQSSYSAPPSQNYYEQRFGPRPGEMDSGYMSADSTEVYKRSFYDRYNFKMMTGRDHIIRVDTIEDNSDGGNTLTNHHIGEEPSVGRGNILDVNRFEDLEHMVSPPPPPPPPAIQQTMAARPLHNHSPDGGGDSSDADSDKTLTHSNTQSGREHSATTTSYSSEDDEQGQSTCYGSSETDGETNADDMWESGAESIETHSVLYKMVRKS